MQVYFVRHGESAGNIQHPDEVISKQDRDALSEKGRKQARQLGERLRDEKLTHILASPMVRGRETAEIINQSLSIKLDILPYIHEVEQSDEFYKANPGSREKLRNYYWLPNSDPSFAPPGAESFSVITARVKMLQEYLVKHASEKRILVVTHNGFMRFFFGTVLWQDDFSPGHYPRLLRIHTNNTGISIFEYDKVFERFNMNVSGWRLLTWNDQAHL